MTIKMVEIRMIWEVFNLNKGKYLDACERSQNEDKISARLGSGVSPLFDLADRLKGLKEQKKQKESELKNVNDMIFEVESALAELMTLSETQNFTRSGTMFSLTTSTKASTKAGRKDELYALLKDAGYGDLVVETVNPSSLSAFVKEQISENDDVLPQWLEGLVNVFEKTSVSIRKNKK